MQFVLLALQVLKEALDSNEVLVPIDYPTLPFCRQAMKGYIERNAFGARKPLHLIVVRTVTRLSPGLNRTFSQCFVLVGYDQVNVKINGVAEPLTTGTGTVWVVKGEQPRLRLGVDDVAALAFETFVEHQSFW